MADFPSLAWGIALAGWLLFAGLTAYVVRGAWERGKKGRIAK